MSGLTTTLRTAGDAFLAAARAHPRRVRLGLWCAGGFAFPVAATLAVLGFLAPDVAPGTPLLTVNRPPGLTFLDRDGAVIGARGEAQGPSVALAELPPHLPAAFIAIEDRRFYDHGGVDTWGVGRALYVNWNTGRMVQGGSTITQQMVKNVFLTHERSLRRKVEEVGIALWVEDHYSKDEILSAYLNRIYLGAGAYGVEAAARTYFGKSAREVTLSESALLAALTRAPSRLSDPSQAEAIGARANLVLDAMVETGAISPEQAQGAKAAPAQLAARRDGDAANWFLDFAEDEVQRLGLAGKTDLVVQTTYDPKLQTAAQEAMVKALDGQGDKREVSQAAVVMLEPDGALRALIGGRDYLVTQFNRAYQARRQPGSAFKPFVYTAALEYGLFPDSVEIDEPLRIDNWSPENYGQSYMGPVTLRTALARSLNTVAAQLGSYVGIPAVREAAARLGIRSPLNEMPSLSLGTSEVSLLELTASYGAFQTSGFQVTPYAVLKATDPNGAVVFERTAPERPQRVMARSIAEDMNQMLFEVVRTGTGRGAALPDRTVCGKTGTSQEFRDAWFVGYTAQFLTGVWVGNDDGTPMRAVTGGSLPAAIWKSAMTVAQKDLPAEPVPGARVVIEEPLAPAVIVDSGNEWSRDRVETPARQAQTRPRPPHERSFWDRLFGRP